MTGDKLDARSGDPRNCGETWAEIELRRAHESRVSLNSASLDAFPCYHGRHDPGYMCSAGCRERVDSGEWSCVVLPIFRAHIKLRSDHAKLRNAVLGGMTAEEAAEMYRRAGEASDDQHWGALNHGELLRALADAVEEMKP